MAGSSLSCVPLLPLSRFKDYAVVLSVCLEEHNCLHSLRLLSEILPASQCANLDWLNMKNLLFSWTHFYKRNLSFNFSSSKVSLLFVLVPSVSFLKLFVMIKLLILRSFIVILAPDFVASTTKFTVSVFSCHSRSIAGCCSS